MEILKRAKMEKINVTGNLSSVILNHNFLLDLELIHFEQELGLHLHFFYHRDRRKTDMVPSTPQKPRYEPLQLLHTQIMEALAILHPSI